MKSINFEITHSIAHNHLTCSVIFSLKALSTSFLTHFSHLFIVISVHPICQDHLVRYHQDEEDKKKEKVNLKICFCL